MQTIQLQQNGDVYSCDIDISKEEWLEFLQDEGIPDEYRDALLRFYYMPEHKGTCTAVSNEIGGDAQSLNSYITKIGQFVQKKLNRFQIVRPNGMPCFWIVPMREGKDLPKGSDGTFEWLLRPELVEATHDYLYWYLVEKYKEVRKNIPLDGEKYDEIYKWKLLTASKGKTPFEIVANHVAHSSKPELGGFTNLIDAVRDNKALKYLVETKPSELEKVLNRLADESVNLNKRLLDFKNAMAALLPPTGYNSKANDERTASTILTCLNPDKYTIYKYDVYRMFCKYLGVSYKPSGQCFEQFLELLAPLCEITKNDEQVQQLVASSLEGKRKSDLLLAQDVLWVLFSEFPQELGYLQPLLWRKKKRVWLWGGNTTITEQKSLGCGSSTNSIKDFRPYTSADSLKKALLSDKPDIGNRLPDAYWKFMREVSAEDIVVAFETQKENGKQYHLLYGWGTFTTDIYYDEGDDNPIRREVEWHLPFLDVPIEDRTMGDSLFFQGTTEKQANRIIELLNINSEKKMESKYQKYIDLLKTNKNLILTGAPGTGKTYMAKAIAQEIGAKVGFVQFHPSYDYTDFVEGLRPQSNDNDNIWFERKDGVFKDFCKGVLLSPNSFEPKKNAVLTDSVSEALQLFKNDIKKQGGIDIKSFRSTTLLKVILNDKNNIAVAHISNPWSVSDDKMLDYLQNKICHEKDTYTKTIGDYILDHYYINENNSDNKNVERLKLNHPDIIPSDEIDTFQSIANKNKDNSNIKPYIFIIDEINRGEISKIFGELFFSIDPGYRGEKGRVNTQYQNIIEDGDVFKDGFYVPDNVYIIGTMNDIDRSVESMDFAMRRRFAWIEVTAEESYANMIENDSKFAFAKDEIKARMFNLNKAIAETEGLDEAYQIGAAYFRKYLDYQNKANPFDCLWDNHLKGLLFEYLRGNRRAKELLEKLHKAYNKTSIDE